MRQLSIFILVLASCGAALGKDSYRCVDDSLDLDLIHSDPEAFYISMDMDPRGNLYVGGRDAVYLFKGRRRGWLPSAKNHYEAARTLVGVFVTGSR